MCPPIRHFASLVLRLLLLACLIMSGKTSSGAEWTAEFIYQEAPFPSCHASTLAETPDGIVAAWFGGTYEKHPDVGIWVARRTATGWTEPREVANGVQPPGSDGESRYPCWNPVLFAWPDGPLMLFYKVGPDPQSWWGMVTFSEDNGRSWSAPERLPEGIYGPIENKPILLDDGRLLCGSSTEDRGWRVHMEWATYNDGTLSWDRTEALNSAEKYGAIQPTLLRHSDSLQMLCRSRRCGKILSASSQDGGRHWSQLEPLDLPNPNSGIDAVTLADGRHLLVYNHTPRGRTPLNVALSEDGVEWQPLVTLEDEPGEYSYPAVIQAADGTVHISYTWKRKRIRYGTLQLNESGR